MRPSFLPIAAALCVVCLPALADPPPAPPAFDAPLAERLGADEHGMRSYVLVILKTEMSPRDKSGGITREMNDSSTWIKEGRFWKCVMHAETPANVSDTH